MTDDVIFRAGVGAIILDDQGRVLAFERTEIPQAWQLPQGGMNPGEQPFEAVLREVREETSIPADSLELLGEHPEWLAYEFPPGRIARGNARGQLHKWFAFRFVGEVTQIDPLSAESAEFSAWRWTTLRELAADTVEFKRAVYARLVEHFADLLG